MDIQSVLAALFLHLASEENGSSNEVLLSHFTSEVVIEIARKEGYKDLADAMESAAQAYKIVETAMDEASFTKAERNLSDCNHKIETFI